MSPNSLLIAATLAGGVSFYVLGLATGTITLVGYETGNVVSRGIAAESEGLGTFFRGFPVYLPEGHAIRADYDVDATVGSLYLVIMQPFWSKVRATAYVAGTRRGSVVFVARTSGWYKFYADTSTTFGRSCHRPDASMVDVLTGRDGCPHYDIRYTVSWHLAAGSEAGPGHVTVPIAGPTEKTGSARIGP
jgi:hypothetical protein